ncbi:MAG: phenylalanine--tRNA ligase subunit beta, partial [Balneolales bacterium]|nr:phenylalanine--tRNA ligase subunit beta [Balneolales bacterium]
KMTLIGLEEEETFEYGSKLDGVIVGEVLETKPHPNADRLTLCQVNLGEQSVQIVCGAKNVAAGQKVPVATVGTTLPLKLDNGSLLTLRKAKLRGEESNGMICSESELGVSDDHSGIMVLDESLAVGTPISEVLDIYTDTIIDFAVTPNRPDSTCHLGVARDLSAALNIPLEKPEIELPKTVTESSDISVSIENAEKCHRFVGKMIKGVEIKESPQWLQNRLKAIGARPVNNVVDVTNYVMFELGQPLHAYDYDEIKGKQIIVKDFQQEVEFETLDHNKRKCAPGTLFICDGRGPVGIAGVMGGLYSEVSDSTKNIFLEGAYFDPGTVRKTAKAQTLQTDASYRFERGIDPNLQARAVERAAQLIVEVAGGEMPDEILDIHPTKTRPVEITLTKSYLNRLLGTTITIDESVDILNGLELELISKSADEATFKIPTFRPDLVREVDVIEEVGRLYDYNRIDAPSHGIFISTEEFSDWELLLSRIRATGVELGFREIYTNSLISEKEASQFGSLDFMVKTLNPITTDMTTLRPSLLHGFLKAASYNFNRQSKGLRFFEIGNVFENSDQSTFHEGIKEDTHLLFGISGLKNTEHWTAQPTEYSIFDLKQLLNGFFLKLGLLENIKAKLNDNYLAYFVGKQQIGKISGISKELAKTYDLSVPVFFAEFSISAIQSVLGKNSENSFKPIPKFPVFEFDFAVIVDQQVTAGELMSVIKVKAGNTLQSIDIFDVFEDESLGNEKKSLAFRLNFIDPNKTLNINEVQPIINRTVKALENQYGARLRG